MISPFQNDNFPAMEKCAKLAPNLFDKEDYITHYRNLKFYVEQGLVVKKIHKVLAFTQESWLEGYINYNTIMRAASSSSFAKDFYKLMNNAVFGKTNENLRNRVSAEIITNRQAALKLCKPNMKRSYNIHENLVVIEKTIETLKLNKPIYVGFTVLELSKLWM